MSYIDASSLGDLARGGQLLLHFLRMLGQVVCKFAGATLIAMVLMGLALFVSRTDSFDRYLGFRYALAWVDVELLKTPNRQVLLEREDGSRIQTSPAMILNSPPIQSAAEDLRQTAIGCAVGGVISVGMLFCLVVGWLWRTGYKQRLEQHIRGARIVEAADLRGVLRREGRASDLCVADVPLVRGTETSHMLISGSPGTGKSTAIHQLLKRIRARGDRCICFSPSGDFIQWFYREGEDRVLNPFDARCPSWNLWEECAEPFHHDMIAAAVVPDLARSSDPFWNIAARTVLASLTQTMALRGECTIPRLLELMTQVDLDVLYQYLRGTEGSALLDPSSEKTAVSIRTTAATYARAFRYLPVGRDTFHIREWVHDEQRKGWMFLNAQRDQIDSVRPLLSAWLEVFTNALTSLSPSRTRRIWLVIDELHSLNRIPSLGPFLAEARKYGGCGVIAFHQVAQLRERYGRDGAEALTGACATWVCMRQNDPETAKWIAQSFGQVEVFESHQGLSYGANDIRDGVSLSRVRKVRPLLLDAEVARLDDLEGYIRLPGQLPMGHFRQAWKPTRSVAPAYVPSPKVDIFPEDTITLPEIPRPPQAAPVHSVRPLRELAIPGLFDDVS